MCGICGAIWTEDSAAISRPVLEQMTNAIAHRGPDAAGYFYEPEQTPGVALGHRRLSIIDVAHGQQPMHHPQRTLVLTFNGEIYNYKELRKTLQGLGHQFETESDTEVLLKCYAQYGPECVEHLRGMFAIAIWDGEKERLFLARDRMGQKPLYYRQESNRFLFASELKALLQVPGIPRELDQEALDLFLTFQYVPHPWSILQGFRKLAPGHFAIWKKGDLQVEQYWHPPYEKVAESTIKARRDYAGAVQQLRELVTEAVRLRLRSDVPLGAFLSGGIDSTIITGVMQQELAQPVQTFSIGFDVARFDETSYARMAANKLGTDHHEQIVSPSALDSLPKLIWHYEEPFADSSAIPTMALCEVTRRSVKVALSGDGGDELFAGYDRYRAVRLGAQIDALPAFVKKLMTTRLWQKLPGSVQQKTFTRRLKRFLSTAAMEPRQRYMQWISYFAQSQREELYHPEYREVLSAWHAERWMDSLYDQFASRDFVTATSAVDEVSYLPGDILTKVDIASMAVGLECRSPFLDHHVAEFAAQLPIEYKLRGKVGKRILRDAFQEFIPDDIMHRPKMGFGVPVDHWFRGELKPLLYDVLLSEQALERGYLNPDYIRKLVEEHTTSLADHSNRLWALLVLEYWFREFIDAGTVSERSFS